MSVERNYSVTGPHGFRRGNLTRAQALALVASMTETMRRQGWAGKVRAFYRDGTEVTS